MGSYCWSRICSNAFRAQNTQNILYLPLFNGILAVIPVTPPGIPVQPSQYTLLSGIAPRTPPRGSATSPAYRGMRCINVRPAAARTFTPTL